MSQYRLTLPMLCLASLLTTPVFANAPVEDAVAFEAEAPASQAVMAESDMRQAEVEAPAEVAPVPVWHNAGRDQHTQTYAASMATSAAPDIARIQQQVNNIVAMGLPQKIHALQQQLAQLRGQLQQQAHQLQAMKRVNATVTHAAPKALSVGVAAKKASYHQAFTQLVNKQYASARTQFKRYIKEQPNGLYVSNAYYWLAEIALIERRYADAEASLKVIIQRYAHSQKYPDARYKLAMTHRKMHRDQEAKVELEGIKRDFPASTVARLASIALEQMALEQS